MVQMPPEMDPDERPDGLNFDKLQAELKASIDRLNAKYNWPTEPPGERTLEQIQADLKSSLQRFNAPFPGPHPSASEAANYGPILDAVAKLQADVTRSLQILSELQARFPPRDSVDPAPPPAQ